MFPVVLASSTILSFCFNGSLGMVTVGRWYKFANRKFTYSIFVKVRIEIQRDKLMLTDGLMQFDNQVLELLASLSLLN